MVKIAGARASSGVRKCWSVRDKAAKRSFTSSSKVRSCNSLTSMDGCNEVFSSASGWRKTGLPSSSRTGLPSSSSLGSSSLSGSTKASIGFKRSVASSQIWVISSWVVGKVWDVGLESLEMWVMSSPTMSYLKLQDKLWSGVSFVQPQRPMRRT